MMVFYITMRVEPAWFFISENIINVYKKVKMMEFLKIKDKIDYSDKKHKLKREIERIFEGKGYIYIQPAIFEDYDSFSAFGGILKKESTVKVVSDNFKILILRPDITLNILKNLIPLWEENLKLKLFYDAAAYRSKLNSTVMEFEQMGIEYLGEDSIKASEEVIEIALTVLKKFNDNFILELGSSRYINGIFNEINVNEKDSIILKKLIYKKSKYEIADFIKTLNLRKQIRNIILNILDFQGSIDCASSMAGNFYMNKEMEAAIEELKILSNLLKDCCPQNIYCDLSMVTELDYYTGVVFKGYYPDSSIEVISGGKYDSLTEKFGRKISAVGFSIDTEELSRVFCGGSGCKWS